MCQLLRKKDLCIHSIFLVFKTKCIQVLKTEYPRCLCSFLSLVCRIQRVRILKIVAFDMFNAFFYPSLSFLLFFTGTYKYKKIILNT